MACFILLLLLKRFQATLVKGTLGRFGSSMTGVRSAYCGEPPKIAQNAQRTAIWPTELTRRIGD